ncbi:hypothetical protein [Thalassiella azotivora]
MTDQDLDVGAVLTAADRLLRTLRGPLGGSATWEWGDLLAATTGRSPFEMTTVVRSIGPQVEEPAAAEPADVARQLVRLADALPAADGDRVRAAAHLLDPARGGRPVAGPPVADPPVAGSPAPVPSPPRDPQQHPAPPPQQHPGPPPQQHPAPPPAPSPTTVLPGGLPPSSTWTPLPAPPREAPPPRPYRPPKGAAPPRRRRPGPWIGLAVLGFFILRGCIEAVSRGGG